MGAHPKFTDITETCFETTAYPQCVHETMADRFVSTHLTSRANARMPAARGAEALVPVW